MRAAIHREWANAMIADSAEHCNSLNGIIMEHHALCTRLQLNIWTSAGAVYIGGTSVCVRPPPEQCRAAGELQGAQLNPYQGFTSSKGALGFEAFPGRALGALGRLGRRGGTRFCAQVSILCLGQSWAPCTKLNP